MSKYFTRNTTEEKYIRYPEDVKKIREYLEGIGTLNCTDRELSDLYDDFSDSVYSAGWMNIDATTICYNLEIENYVEVSILEQFADWLEDDD